MSDAFALFLIESSTVRASLQQCVSKLAGSDAEGALNTAIASADQAVKVNEQLEVLYRNLQKEASKLQTNKDPDVSQARPCPLLMIIQMCLSQPSLSKLFRFLM